MRPVTGRDAETVISSPAVPADAYDEHYFLHLCLGSEDWRESGGAEVAPYYHGMLNKIGVPPGSRLLDVGTGRGELLRVALERGAGEAVGVDYSDAAVSLARRTLELGGCGDRASVMQADARQLPFPDAQFDLVTMLDIVEHLSPAELHDALRDARRVLRPGGRIYVHTAPNRLIYSVAYPLLRLRPDRLLRWPAEPRGEKERELHVNEQTVGSLRRALRAAGFDNAQAELGNWVYVDFIPDAGAQRTLRRLTKVPFARRVAIGDLFAWGTR
jgi:SAM-dependent methyltransferase